MKPLVFFKTEKERQKFILQLRLWMLCFGFVFFMAGMFVCAILINNKIIIIK